MKNLMLPCCLSILLVACTRKTDDTSTLSLSFNGHRTASKVAGLGASADLTLSTLIINISGPGIDTPIFKQWDSHSGSASKALSTDVTIEDIPRGDSRLVQALGVYQDSNQKMYFYYGDASKGLSSDNEEVNIVTASMGSAAFQGRVYGRFLDGVSPGGGPTGILTAKFQPGGGKPAMQVMTSEMLSGWMNLMVLDSASFTYSLNGKDLFKSINYFSPLFAGSNRILKVAIPSYQRNNGGQSLSTEAENRVIEGFFGPGALATQQACYDNRSGQSLQGAFQSDGVTPLVWNGLSPSTTQAGPEASTGTGYNPAGAATVCSATANEFVDHLIFHYEMLRNGHDGVAGFRGPFRLIPVGGGSTEDFVDSSVAAGITTLTWRFLPGVTDGPNGIAGVTAYYKAMDPNGQSNDDIYSDTGIVCSKLPALGFTVIGSDLLTTPDQVNASLDLPNVPNNAQIVLCPYSTYLKPIPGRLYHDAGIQLNGHGAMTPQNNIGLKMVGSSVTSSRLYGPVFPAAGITLLKSSSLDMFHQIVISAGSQFMQCGQLTDLEATVDNGTTWTSLYTHCFNSSYTNAPSVATLSLSYLSGLGVTANVDTTLMLRITPTATAATSLGIGSSPWISSPIHLIGSATCPSPGGLQLYDVGSSAIVTTPNTFMNNFSTNGTDVTKDLRLAWSGCTPAVYEILDQTSSTGTISPTGCFGDMDVQSDTNDPLLFHMHPHDIGANCSLTGFSMNLIAPSNANSVYAGISASASTITHSTANASIGIMLRVSQAASNSGNPLLLDLGVIAPNTSLGLQGVYLNGSGKITNTVSPSGLVGSSSWSLAPATNWGGNPASAPWVTAVSAAAPSTNLVVPSTVSFGTQLGNMNLMVLPTSSNYTFLAASENNVSGGSPLLLYDNGSALQLGFIQSQFQTGYVGQPITTLNMPTDTVPVQGPTSAKLFLINGMGNSYVLLALQYGANLSYYLGAFNNGMTPSIAWAPVSINPNGVAETAYDMMMPNGNNSLYVVSHFASSDYISIVQPATYNGTSWTTPTINYSSPTNITGYYSSIFGFAQCSNEYFVVGKQMSTANFLARVFNPVDTSVSGLPVLNAGVSAGSATQAACFSSGPGPRTFLTYSPTSSTTSFYAFEGHSPACGSTADSIIATSTSSVAASFYTGTGIQFVATPPNAPSPTLLLAYQPAGSSQTAVASISLGACSSSTQTINATPVANGGLLTPATQLKGLRHFNGWSANGNPASGMFTLFGVGSFFQFHLN